MKYRRAEEIINSEETFYVYYNQQSVWIQNLNPQTESAQVMSMDNKVFDVPVHALVEK
ncbi:H-type small acid-soluble spore protein [Tepidibacillus marianensis]|uniref:H-type small acid-soluble spore protein n=1 Tax=Tepidibacillus marianensis TaxID=3131995 RepID=UPI0030CE9071